MLSKLALDDAGMARCIDCGKLYQVRDETAGRSQSDLCRLCARERGEEALFQAMDPDAALREKTERLMALFNDRTKTVARTPRQAEGLLLPPVGPLCSRCKKHEPIEDSDFCLSCHLELDNVLGAASRDLLSRVELYEPARKRTKGASIMDSYGERAAELGKNAVVPPHSQSPRSI